MSAANLAENGGPVSTTAKRAQYASRIESLRADSRRLRRQLWTTHVFGVAAALAGAGAILAGFELWIDAELCCVIGTACFLALVMSSFLAFRRRDEIDLVERLARVNARGVARIDRDWPRLALSDFVPFDDLLDSSHDLDLFGRASLFQLVCRARTPWGKAEIGTWIAIPADLETIRRRQAAIRELTPQLEYRQRLEAIGSFVESLADRSERFRIWLNNRHDERWLAPATWIARVLTLASVSALAWLAFSDADRTRAGLVLTGIVLINILYSIAMLGRVHTLFAIVVEGANDGRRYRQLIDAAADRSPSADWLVELHGIVAPASRGIRYLEWLAWLSSLQSLQMVLLLSALPLLFLLYVLLQFVLLWDFHVAAALSWWRRRFGAAIEEALTAVGMIEAVASLASLADEHPDWTFAQIRTDGVRILQADGLGHPLLPPSRCVRNDVTVGPPGSVLVVTGSNMSGKSTLLRAVGTNSVLAQAGGPVCARAFVMPPAVLVSVMRVTDSLDEGISLFMAELLRIRQVVDAAERLDGDPDRVLLFLLDEILSGTNNAERRIAAVGILSHLLAKNAVGVVSTHDLDLVSQPSIAAKCRTVYFRESFTAGDANRADPRMVFDYIMRAGVAPTTNVPFLLKAVGLPFGPPP